MQTQHQFAVNYEDAKSRFGPIKRSQRWMKRDTGRQFVIKSRDKNNAWKVCFEGGVSRVKTHTIKERDIYKFYEKL